MSYTPSDVPTSAEALPSFLAFEHQSIARAFTSQQPYVYIQTLNVAPTKPKEGQIAKADGTNWNPGSGAGVYVYQAGVWVAFSAISTAEPANHSLLGGI